LCYSIPFFASHKSAASIDALKIVLIEFDANGRLIASPTTLLPPYNPYNKNNNKP
jgi:hypothetical protein